MRTYHDMFRPVYEQVALLGWMAGAVAVCLLRPPYWILIALAALGCAAWRAKEVAGLYRFRLSISALRVEKMDSDTLVRISRPFFKKQAMWLGRGFKWTQRHAELSRQIIWRDPTEIAKVPAWLPGFIRKRLEPPNFVPFRDDAIGVPWIHGLEAKEHELAFPLESLEGHTLVTGTTGAGKTRLYELISTQIIHNGDVLVIIDPKGDKAWEERVRKECQKTGRRFLYLSPAHPSRSIRMQPLQNWNSISEPATRIAQLVDANGSFLSFAWKTLFDVMRGMAADGMRPNLMKAKDYVQGGIEPLLFRLIKKAVVAVQGDKWKEGLRDYKPDDKAARMSQIKDENLLMLVGKYEAMREGERVPRDEVIDALIVMARHPREHYQKMAQVLKPILSMLGDDELGKILSPDPLDMTDTRPIYDTGKVIETNAVLYVGLDSLSNKTIGAALGSILLADFASAAGAIYNFGDSGKRRNVYLMVDEAAEVMNDQAIQLLNKGRGAGIRVMVATQTIADFDALFGSSAKSRQTLGNLNNVISLRVKDMEMAKFIAESFGKTSARRISRTQSVNASSAKNIADYSGSRSRSIQEEEIPFVSPDLLTRLPGLQYFAFLAGSTLYKGRVPLLVDD